MSDTTQNGNPFPDQGAGAAGELADDEESPDYSHLFRSEGLVSDVDLRVDVAKNYSRFVAGDEDISLETSVQGANANMSFIRGSRTRSAGSFEHITGKELMMTVANSVEETVHGGVHLKAVLSAEAIVGGAYANTIAGPYLRVAGWVDSMAWGGWAEADAQRAELSLLMIRSHMGYAHAATVRGIMASSLIDDFQTRTENFGMFTQTGATYQDAGAPGGGIYNEV